MDKNKLLEEIQKYSNQAFEQGYAAKERKIDKDDKRALREMPEALTRLDCARRIFNQVMGTNIELGNLNGNV